MPCGRANRIGQVDAARCGQRPGPALHGRHAHRIGSRVRPRHPRPPAAGPRRRRGCGRPEPPRGLRHRHRRGGARLRDGTARARPGRHAQAGRGDARPARPGRPATPPVARPFRRSAATGGHRFGAHHAPPGAGPRRADVSAGSECSRGGAGRDHPPGARPRRHGAARRAPHRARPAVCRPPGPPEPGGTGPGGATRRADGHLVGRAAGR